MNIINKLPIELKEVIMKFVQDRDEYNVVMKEFDKKFGNYICEGQYIDNHNLDSRFFSNKYNYDMGDYIMNKKHKLYFHKKLMNQIREYNRLRLRTSDYYDSDYSSEDEDYFY